MPDSSAARGRTKDMRADWSQSSYELALHAFDTRYESAAHHGYLVPVVVQEGGVAAVHDLVVVEALPAEVGVRGTPSERPRAVGPRERWRTWRQKKGTALWSAKVTITS